jgi:phosphoglycerol transferase MdoB-like AlkP superfamily enzyme
MEQLEAAGIADDTVIVLTTDHYPYGLVENGQDYYVELSGINDTVNDVSRYKNSLILWCGSMEEPVVVDTPCSSIDIVPTLCNLFGIAYDSRLYSGRDVFAENYTPYKASTSMPLVVFPMGNSYSWITDAGVYDANKGVFTPYEGVQVSDNYVDTVSLLASAKFAYAKQVLQRDYYGIIEKELEQ